MLRCKPNRSIWLVQLCALCQAGDDTYPVVLNNVVAIALLKRPTMALIA